MYAELDKLKDKNGRYLLQDSITAASGKQLLGRPVIVLDDDMIGTEAGNLVGFVGDAKAFCAFLTGNALVWSGSITRFMESF